MLQVHIWKVTVYESGLSHLRACRLRAASGWITSSQHARRAQLCALTEEALLLDTGSHYQAEIRRELRCLPRDDRSVHEEK